MPLHRSDTAWPEEKHLVVARRHPWLSLVSTKPECLIFTVLNMGFRLLSDSCGNKPVHSWRPFMVISRRWTWASLSRSSNIKGPCCGGHRQTLAGQPHPHPRGPQCATGQGRVRRYKVLQEVITTSTRRVASTRCVSPIQGNVVSLSVHGVLDLLCFLGKNCADFFLKKELCGS
jgi:hypothetical protein